MKLTDIKPGTKLQWTQVVDRYRGYVKTYEITVVSRQGKNIEDAHGDFWWWPMIARWNPSMKDANPTAASD